MDKRDRPAEEIEITAEMISAGVSALHRLCPFDVAFPVGGEEDAVEAVLIAALRAHGLADSESIQRSFQMISLVNNISGQLVSLSEGDVCIIPLFNKAFAAALAFSDSLGEIHPHRPDAIVVSYPNVTDIPVSFDAKFIIYVVHRIKDEIQKLIGTASRDYSYLYGCDLVSLRNASAHQQCRPPSVIPITHCQKQAIYPLFKLSPFVANFADGFVEQFELVGHG